MLHEKTRNHICTIAEGQEAGTFHPPPFTFRGVSEEELRVYLDLGLITHQNKNCFHNPMCISKGSNSFVLMKLIVFLGFHFVKNGFVWVS